ncbi:hypothetical protein [Streptomyces sp. NPDC058953]|uniref:hypothetical protein n=1 Tax=unclassified Streptomyces TaxID=2593676 RepID=UPI0036B82643
MVLKSETVLRNLWAAPAMFIMASFISFALGREDGDLRFGWMFYFAGWIPPLVALVWCGARRENPGVGGVFALVVLLFFGLLYWLTYG